ncbi:glycosyltransferase family 1 protein, partial [bacterium]|nr:glycosyltransferase family 1 protein [bacterium]
MTAATAATAATAPPRRILCIDHAGVLGGAELSLRDLAVSFGESAEVLLLADGPFRAALTAQGVRVDVEPLGALGAVKKDAGLPSLGALMDAAGIAKRVARRARAYDVLYANSQKAFVVAAAAGLLARRPVVWHLRDILEEPHFSRANITAAAQLANLRAAGVIANSRATADAFVAAGGHRELVHVVHNGIDVAPFDALSSDAGPEARRALGVPAEAFLVALFGRFHPWKGQQVLLDALAELPGVHALIVGAPLFGETAFEAAQHERARALGIADRVHWLGFRDDIPALMRAADVVVHTSVLPEPFGRVVVEGMLAGRPVVATRAGGVPEIMTEGETGCLVPPADAPALARAIRGLRDNPAGAAAMAARGAAHARAQFSAGAMCAGVARALDAILQEVA